MNATQNITTENLEQFSGTTSYRWSDFKALKMTDGVQFLQDNGAGWLITAIASYQPKLNHDNNGSLDFQVWQLSKIEEDGKTYWKLICQADAGEPLLVEQVIEYSDFPLLNIKLFVCDNVLMLPSEY